MKHESEQATATAGPGRPFEPADDMQLQVYSSACLLLDKTVVKIIAEAGDGSFCLLPRHIDFLAELPLGLIQLQPLNEPPSYCAVDKGILVKCGRKVSVVAFSAAYSEDIERLNAVIAQQYGAQSAVEEQARSALARLEAAALRGIADLRGPSQ